MVLPDKEDHMDFSNWLMIHGTSAKVQDSNTVSGMGYYGWGLEFVAGSGQLTWVHIAVPTAMSATFATFIRIYFGSGPNAPITQVHVWNGPTKVKQFSNLKLSGAQQYKELDLGGPIHFEAGMGISIGVSGLNDPDSTAASRKFTLSGAGAFFETK
jgi:hypothetical protein